MSAHPHAENMRQYAEDAAETSTPWERWECLHPGSETWDRFVNGGPCWLPHIQYRRKPRTIRIGEFDVPEPVREPLQIGQGFWRPSLSSGDGVSMASWRGVPVHCMFLERGLVHLTYEAAELHAKALLSFTSPTP